MVVGRLHAIKVGSGRETHPSYNTTLERKGRVLIPVPAVGRAQEIMLIIDGYMNGAHERSPVFIEGMISRQRLSIPPIPEYLGREVRHSILHEEVNPFQSDYFTIVEHRVLPEHNGRWILHSLGNIWYAWGRPVIEYSRTGCWREKHCDFCQLSDWGYIGKACPEGCQRSDYYGQWWKNGSSAG